MTDNWTDRIVGARMAVDREFNSTLEGSEFTRQEWGLVMTAVDFRIEGAEDPESARLVGDVSKLDSVVPELERVGNMQAGLGGPPGDGGGSGGGGGGGGLLGGLKDALGFGGSTESFDDQKAAEAERLVGVYTDELQAFLEKRDRWEEICAVAARSQSD